MVVFIVVAGSGCATPPEPYEYGGFDQELQTGPGELKEGPGLFSGENGYFTIYKQPPSSEKESPERGEQKR